MNVLEEHSDSVYTGHQIIATIGPGQIVCADQLDYMFPYLRTRQFRTLLLHFYHALCQFVTENLLYTSGNT